MAESQVPYPNLPVQVDAIRLSLSEPRFGAYLIKGGNDVGYALALYLYNARLAKAFLYPLHVVEVTFRNAIDGLLVSRYGLAWPHEPALRTGLLTPAGLATLDKAISRTGVGASRGQIIAELTFDFWSHLLRPEYHNLWRTALNVVFPNVRPPVGRHEIQGLARSINRFRNRVAHHEPVLDQNVSDLQGKIIELIGLRCAETAAWTRHHTTIGHVLRTRPRGANGQGLALSAKLAPDFVLARADTTLADVMRQLDRSRPVTVCVDDAGHPVAAVSSLDIVRFVIADADRNAGLFAPEERTIADLLADVDAALRTAVLNDTEPLGAAVDVLRRPRVDALVGVNSADGCPTGTILRAHRRY